MRQTVDISPLNMAMILLLIAGFSVVISIVIYKTHDHTELILLEATLKTTAVLHADINALRKELAAHDLRLKNHHAKVTWFAGEEE